MIGDKKIIITKKRNQKKNERNEFCELIPKIGPPKMINSKKETLCPVHPLLLPSFIICLFFDHYCKDGVWE